MRSVERTSLVLTYVPSTSRHSASRVPVRDFACRVALLSSSKIFLVELRILWLPCCCLRYWIFITARCKQSNRKHALQAEPPWLISARLIFITVRMSFEFSPSYFRFSVDPFSFFFALVYISVAYNMGATRPALPVQPLIGRQGCQKRVVSHFQLATSSGAFWLCFPFLSTASFPSQGNTVLV